MIKLIYLMLIIFFSLTSTITVQAVELNTDRNDYNELARSRSYPGGSDEEDLKVKDTINEPTINIYKSNVDQELVEELEKSKSSSESE